MSSLPHSVLPHKGDLLFSSVFLARGSWSPDGSDLAIGSAGQQEVLSPGLLSCPDFHLFF